MPVKPANRWSGATLGVALLSALLAACASGPEIRTDSDPAADFSSYRTFAFFDPVSTDKTAYATVLSTRLKRATQRELERRGYTLAADNPQLLVNFNVNVAERTDIESTPAMGGYYGYRAGRYAMWGGYPQDIQTTHYQEGTLAIDLVDAARRQLVWQGIAQGRISKDAIEKPDEAVDRVVTEIFSRYPVAPAATAQTEPAQ